MPRIMKTVIVGMSGATPVALAQAGAHNSATNTAAVIALAFCVLTIVILAYRIRKLAQQNHIYSATIIEREAQLELLTGNMTDWVWRIDAHNCFSYISPSVTKLLGYSAEEILGKKMETVLHPADYERARSQYAHVLANAKRVGLTGHRDSIATYGLRHKNGQLVWTEAAIRMFFSEQSEFLGAQGSSRDITARHLAEEKIRLAALNDALTELPNRQVLNDRIQKAISAFYRHHQYAALLFIDIDHFKYINENHGYDAGDDLLQQVARRLSSNLRPGTTMARFCGDEFVALTEQLGQDLDNAKHHALREGIKLLELLEREFTLPNAQCRITASIGIVLFNNNSRTVTSLLKLADTAMYQAKASGRNRCVISDAHPVA